MNVIKKIIHSFVNTEKSRQEIVFYHKAFYRMSYTTTRKLPGYLYGSLESFDCESVTHTSDVCIQIKIHVKSVARNEMQEVAKKSRVDTTGETRQQNMQRTPAQAA